MHPDENFISIAYTNIDFLIPKKDVLTALSCAKADFIVDETGTKKIKIDSQLLSYINFDRYAEFLNQPLKPVSIKNCIIINSTSLISGEDKIALITSGECRVKQIKFNEFSLFSNFYGTHFNKKGILACKFNSDKTISYLIETETFLQKYLEQKK